MHLALRASGKVLAEFGTIVLGIILYILFTLLLMHLIMNSVALIVSDGSQTYAELFLKAKADIVPFEMILYYLECALSVIWLGYRFVKAVKFEKYKMMNPWWYEN